jgi:dolichol kinase
VLRESSRDNIIDAVFARNDVSEGEPSQDTSPSAKVRQEVFRKSIHIIGFIVPLMAMFFGTTAAALFITAVSMLYFISEYLRLRDKRFPILTTITNLAMRTGRDEAGNTFVMAPLYFAAGILASLLVFPAPFNYVAIAVVTLGDGAAAIAGRIYGRTRIPCCHGKTLEGSVTGLACAFAGSLIFVSPLTALAAGAAGMLVELLPLRISDNLTMPLIAGLTAVLIATMVN